MIQEYIVQTSNITFYVYLSDPQSVLMHFHSNYQKWLHSQSQVRVRYAVVTSDLNEFIDISQKLSGHQMTQFVNANITPLKEEEEISQFIAKLKSTNEAQFEENYHNLLKTIEENIEVNLVKAMLEKQFGWTSIQATNLIEKEKVNSIDKLLQYGGLGRAQMQKIKLLRDVIQELIK